MSHYELYLVRHAIAAERGDDWPDDRARPLTDRGISRFRQCVTGLVALDVELDAVFTSPLVRARQTAELLAAGVKGSPPVTTLNALSPGHLAADAVTQVARAARGHRLALVGHEPDLGELAARLVGATRALTFKKGGVCRIDVDGLGPVPRGVLVWFASPGMLRLLGKHSS